MSDEQFDRIEQRLDRLEAGQASLQAGQTELQTGLKSLGRDIRSGLTDLDRHMHVLHEDVLSRFAALPEFSGPTKAEFAQGLADIKEAIGRRLDPLEAVVRHHSGEIERLKQGRG